MGRMNKARILLLPGDGIGPEVMSVARKALEVAAASRMNIETVDGLIGGASIDAHGVPITDAQLKAARRCDAVLLGAVGGPAWKDIPHNLRPEQGLLDLRQTLGVYANLRPISVFPQLVDSSPLKRQIIEGTDIMIVRELIGGIYFGKPRGERTTARGRRAFDTEVYYQSEIERIARTAFETARQRRRKVTSVDKANVLASSVFWREIVTKVHREYSDVKLEHMYVDNCAMQIVRDPRQFDVICTGNMFGDILSDEASMVSGSIGMLASASLGKGRGLYEPIHGSAPDIAGRDIANPCAMILSLAMMFRHSLGRADIADLIEKAVSKALSQGYRTADIAADGEARTGTRQMGTVIAGLIQG